MYIYIYIYYDITQTIRLLPPGYAYLFSYPLMLLRMIVLFFPRSPCYTHALWPVLSTGTPGVSYKLLGEQSRHKRRLSSLWICSD